ncbi:hypothetical protein I317_03347 [Kwoniella heveanensis CBS 569]|uniref:Uncharacterized protein n=1 Tax=Kwoniella heveanensis BCC8398 TaxID=1296120 RepID=A0A1B9GLI9_9TREE|nr:hypothetical protein I316_06441 [Kwoniella heveanensis BCC8398]OCF42870.1 hypothetical protein I317_03347 [Kwoniella heveanensis CBS 569]
MSTINADLIFDLSLYRPTLANQPTKDKYITPSTPSLSDLLSPFLSHPSLSSAQSSLILQIIPSVSYTSELQLSSVGEWTWQTTCPELHAVQDADRLDAVGGVGIMRCAAFSCKINRRLVEDDEEGTKGKSAEGHFEVKLLRVRDRMKLREGHAHNGVRAHSRMFPTTSLQTPFGREEAEKRHQTMLDFLAAVERERDLLSQ